MSADIITVRGVCGARAGHFAPAGQGLACASSLTALVHGHLSYKRAGPPLPVDEHSKPLASRDPAQLLSVVNGGF